MADVIRLSCCYSLASLHSTLVVPKFNSFKRVPNKLLHSSSFAPLLTSKLGKRPPFSKVHAVVAEATDQPKWWEKNPGPNMIDIHSTEEFLSALSDAGDKLVVAEFYGTWCASCRALFPRLCRMAEEHPEILFLKVNFDENKPMCKSMNVKVLPYFHFYRGAEGKVEDFSCSLAKSSQAVKSGRVINVLEDTTTAVCGVFVHIYGAKNKIRTQRLSSRSSKKPFNTMCRPPSKGV